VVVASVVEQEVAGELEKRQRGRGGGVEGEQEEASECTKEANGEKEEEKGVQWRKDGVL
jgi:hypothetical protein